jgi:hypothetical protein
MPLQLLQTRVQVLLLLVFLVVLWLVKEWWWWCGEGLRRISLVSWTVRDFAAIAPDACKGPPPAPLTGGGGGGAGKGGWISVMECAGQS